MSNKHTLDCKCAGDRCALAPPCAFHEDRQDECKVYSGEVPCEPVATLPCVKLKVRELESGRLVVEVLAFDPRELTERGTVSVYSAAHVTRLQAEVAIANKREDRANEIIRERDALKDEVARLSSIGRGQRNTIDIIQQQVERRQSELTKARELLRHVGSNMPHSFCESWKAEVYEFLANQSAPGAKDGE